MGQKSRRKRKKVEHPTLFVFEGVIKHYEDGSMFELQTQLTSDEWRQVVEETVKYKLFIECLKEIAFPILKEKWTKVDDWWRVQLGIAVSRMRQIDGMAFLGINQEAIKKTFEDKIKTNAQSVVDDIKFMRETQTSFHGDDPSQATVSNL